MNFFKGSSILLLSILLFAQCGNKDWPEMETVKNVDINKYSGLWYEIARFPHSFEKNLVGVTATYSLRQDGKITVLNKGYKENLNGKLKKTKGKATIPNPDEPGRLKVYFFWFIGADYLILHLDEKDYQYALVGSSGPNYLWILSRTSQMDPEIYSTLVNKAKSLGYDVSRLELVPQKIDN